MRNSFFIVKVENCIDKGSITLWSSEFVYPYLVYREQEGGIHVNTEFYKISENEYECC